jgi:hypothetical protein
VEFIIDAGAVRDGEGERDAAGGITPVTLAEVQITMLAGPATTEVKFFAHIA